MSVNRNPARETRGLIIERVIDAPRERVFKAWTEPQQVLHWWAPDTFVATFCAIDLRPRGRWSVCMRSPDGVDYWTQGVFREMSEPETFVLAMTWQDPWAGIELESVVRATFAEEGGKTRFTFEHTFVEPS